MILIELAVHSIFKKQFDKFHRILLKQMIEKLLIKIILSERIVTTLILITQEIHICIQIHRIKWVKD